MPGVFITGTNNQVGKTHVMCSLLRDLRERGIPAIGFKPIACGNREEARAIRELTDATLTLDAINPYYLRAFAEPIIAAELERKVIDVNVIKDAYRQMESTGSIILVEGTGGWNTPVNENNNIGDIANALQLPILLVVENCLGAVNLASMTLNAIKSKGLTCCGIVLNHIGEEWDTASVTNRSLIEKMTGIPVVAELIHGQDDLDSSFLPGL